MYLCLLFFRWHDAFLVWNPENYDNITETRLPWDKVWTPDIVLYNSAGDGEQGREMRTLIEVKICPCSSADLLWCFEIEIILWKSLQMPIYMSWLVFQLVGRSFIFSKKGRNVTLPCTDYLLLLGHSRWKCDTAYPSHLSEQVCSGRDLLPL